MSEVVAENAKQQVVLGVSQGQPIPRISLGELNTETSRRVPEFQLGEWVFFWTGWKTAWDSSILVSQWAAWSKFGRDRSSYGFYASCPGDAGRYKLGDVFDIRLQPGQQGLDRRDLADPSCFALAETLCLQLRDRVVALVREAVPAQQLAPASLWVPPHLSLWKAPQR